MKYIIILMSLLLLSFYNNHSTFAQSAEIQNEDLNGLVITMKQGLGKGVFLVTINGNGDVIYEGGAVAATKIKHSGRLTPLPEDFKVIRKSVLSDEQIKELVSEIYKIDFFSLNDEYRSHRFADGSSTTFFGHNPLITSITINGKTKRVLSFLLFSPQKLIEFQRKIYVVSRLDLYVQNLPQWLTKLPS